MADESRVHARQLEFDSVATPSHKLTLSQQFSSKKRLPTHVTNMTVLKMSVFIRRVLFQNGFCTTCYHCECCKMCVKTTIMNTNPAATYQDLLLPHVRPCRGKVSKVQRETTYQLSRPTVPIPGLDVLLDKPAQLIQCSRLLASQSKVKDTTYAGGMSQKH